MQVNRLSIFFASRVPLSVVVLACFVFAGNVTGYEKEAKPAPKTPEYPVHIDWANKFANIGVDKYARLIPVVNGSVVIMADTRGGLMHYDNTTGKLRWKKQFDTRFSAGPSLSESAETTILGTQDGDVFALKTSDGEQLWKQTLSSEILSTPQQYNDVVIVQTNDGKVYGLSAQSGKITWVYERAVPVLSLRGNSSPIVVDDQVIVGFASGRLVALALYDGKLLWESTIAVPKGRTELERMTDIDGPVTYKDGVLYVSAYNGQVVAIDADTGRIIWGREMSSQLGVTVGEALVFVTTVSGQVWALDRQSGATLWMQDKLKQRASTRPAIMGDTLIVGDSRGEVYWLSASDGRLLGHLPLRKITELSGATDYVDQLDVDDNYFPPKHVDSAVTFQPQVVGSRALITYQNGILASVSAVN